MTLSFRRSIKGYDPKSVESEISNIIREFQQELDRLNQELLLKTQQIESLKADIQKINKDLNPKVAKEKEISQRLLDSLLKGAEKVMISIKNAEKKETELSEKVNQRKRELLRLQNTTGKMNNDFLTTASRYGSILNWGKEGEIHVKD
ncbi:hypothetical protein DEAC_c18290 [Desulfosporosinus acididurans]|uniref:Uncharacterized protein n=1 Tax=Desulfosporosinus acididurans TaxID=476652 RepID=A0A0J1FSG8_9FIRM|nr:hypothetical protein [Desulfosporosinus acididurans]KLU66430.1 hypothetical protein DEAC_c18290 [Desulfosporosinus acididurans]